MAITIRHSAMTTSTAIRTTTVITTGNSALTTKKVRPTFRKDQ